MLDRLRIYGIHVYCFMFFFILFFRHKNIDTVRVPFFIFIIWQIFKKKLTPKFLLDPVSFSDRSLFILGCAVCFIYITMQFGNFVHSGARTDMAFLVIGLYLSSEKRTQIHTGSDYMEEKENVQY